MKHIFWIIIFFSISLSSSFGDQAGLATYIQYQKGSSIILHLNYYGGMKDWDAGASIEDEILVLTNAMFISVKNSKSETVKPIKDKILSVWADTYFRKPFSLVLDISKFYNLSQPGEYIVQWGCDDVKKESVYIEIVN